MNTRPRSSLLAFAALTWLSILGCERMPPDRPEEKNLPSAYASRHFNDPELSGIAEKIRGKALQEVGPNGKPLYSRAEVLPPVPTVQPYGVGVFQQEVRLPVILTTGPGWASLEPDTKEELVAKTFRGISERLQSLKREPALRPTLTVQTPQGMELTWINHLEISGKNVHGDD